VASRSEVLDKRSIRGEQPLCMARRFEPLHASVTLASRLMRVLGAGVQRAMLAMFHTG
jgi:hypothetical protein